jgi:hypothetical protein
MGVITVIGAAYYFRSPLRGTKCRSNPFLDCFASLAMTDGLYSLSPLFPVSYGNRKILFIINNFISILYFVNIILYLLSF